MHRSLKAAVFISVMTSLECDAEHVLRYLQVQGLKRLTRLIFMRAQPKRLGNQIITGSMLAALATAYVDAINHGAVPTIATAWQACSTVGKTTCPMFNVTAASLQLTTSSDRRCT